MTDPLGAFGHPLPELLSILDYALINDAGASDVSAIWKAVTDKNHEKVLELVRQKEPTREEFLNVCVMMPDTATTLLDAYPRLVTTLTEDDILFIAKNEALGCKLIDCGINCHHINIDRMGKLLGTYIQQERFTLAAKLIDLGADVTFTFANKRTPLHIAVHVQAFSTIEKLLAKGANVLARDESGLTPLTLAKGTLDNVQYQPFSRYDYGQMLTDGKKDKVLELLAHNVPVTKDEAQRMWEQWPDIACQHLAVFAQHCPYIIFRQYVANTEFALAFISHGVQLTEMDFLLTCRSYPELMYNAIQLKPELAKCCTQVLLEDLLDFPQCEALVLKLLDMEVDANPELCLKALEKGRLSIAERLVKLELKAGLQVADSTRIRQVLEALMQLPISDAEKGELSVVLADCDRYVKDPILLCQRCPIVALRFAETQALRYGIEHLIEYPHCEAIVLMRIEQGASVTPRDLTLAVKCNRAHIVAALLAKGVDVNGQDGDMMTPLHYAAQVANKDLVRTLLRQGADVFAKNSSGKTPRALARPDVGVLLRETELEMAIDGRDGPVAEAILRELSEITESIFSRLCSTLPDVATKFITAEAMSRLPSKGKYLIYTAMQSNHAPLAEKLLACGVTPLYAEGMGGTVLERALQRKCSAVATCLMQHLHPDLRAKTLEAWPLPVLKDPHFVRGCCSDSTTALELPFLLLNYELLTDIKRSLSPELVLQGIELLLLRYPQLRGDILDFFFAVQPPVVITHAPCPHILERSLHECTPALLFKYAEQELSQRHAYYRKWAIDNLHDHVPTRSAYKAKKHELEAKEEALLKRVLAQPDVDAGSFDQERKLLVDAWHADCDRWLVDEKGQKPFPIVLMLLKIKAFIFREG